MLNKKVNKNTSLLKKKKKKVCNLQGLQGNSEANSWLRLKYKMSGHCYQNDSLQTWPINERVNDKAE